MTNDRTRPDPGTEEAERSEAAAAHEPDRPPTPEEEEAAEQSRLDPAVAESYKEAIERGAELKGEGEIS